MTATRTGRGNRLGLGVLGAILLVGGAAALAQTQGLFVSGSQHNPLLTNSESRFARENITFWIALAALAAIVTVLCARWLLTQLRRDSVRSLQLEPDRSQGATRLPSGLVTGAVEDEIATYPGVPLAPRLSR